MLWFLRCIIIKIIDFVTFHPLMLCQLGPPRSRQQGRARDTLEDMPEGEGRREPSYCSAGPTPVKGESEGKIREEEFQILVQLWKTHGVGQWEILKQNLPIREILTKRSLLASSPPVMHSCGPGAAQVNVDHGLSGWGAVSQDVAVGGCQSAGSLEGLWDGSSLWLPPMLLDIFSQIKRNTFTVNFFYITAVWQSLLHMGKRFQQRLIKYNLCCWIFLKCLLRL